MSSTNRHRRERTLLATAWFILSATAGFATACEAATAPDSAAHAATAPDPDGGWPRSLTTATGAALIIYQPQILSWDAQRNLVAMAALSYLAKGATTPKLGTVQLESPTSVSIDERLVNLQKVTVKEIHFSALGKDQSQEVLSEVKSTMPAQPLVISLDRVLAAMDKSHIRADGIQVNTDPPPIYFSARPAVLVGFDGAPILSPIEGTSLQYVVNTNWDVFLDTTTKIYYLRNDSYWLQTTDPKGAWAPAGKLPESFGKLPADDNWKDVKANLPGQKIDKKKVPTVFASEKPAELILLDGAAKFEPVKGTNLLWVSNTESDIFRVKDGDFFFLVSGRWFRAKQLEGPWAFASAHLPADFRSIPGDHPRARVRSSVPGTQEAAEAVLLAQVPQTARVNAKEVKAPEVKYAGDPQFKPAGGSSSVSYSENSSNDVLKVGDTYYLCYLGVWFASSAPTGPWLVTTTVPSAIYSIPPSSPVYNVTYVTVVNPDPYYPTYAYTPGYTGVTISFGCCMYGTGWYYPPYYYYPPHGYPVYYPRPVSYGCGAMYNPHTGAYGYYQHAYGPYGGVARGASHNPYTGTYKRGAMAYGPYGAQGYAQAYNPRTGTYASTRQGSNVYGSWGSSSVQRGDDWARTQRVTDANGNTRWAAQGSGGGSAQGWNTNHGSGFVGQKDGNVYAGKDGNVYRKTDNGWQSYDGAGNGWNDVSGGAPKASTGQASAGAAQKPATGATMPSAGAAQQPATGATMPSAGAARQPAAGATMPSGAAAQKPAASANPATMDQLNHDANARSQGDQRTQSNSGAQATSTASPSRARSGGGRRR